MSDLVWRPWRMVNYTKEAPLSHFLSEDEVERRSIKFLGILKMNSTIMKGKFNNSYFLTTMSKSMFAK